MESSREKHKTICKTITLIRLMTEKQFIDHKHINGSLNDTDKHINASN